MKAIRSEISENSLKTLNQKFKVILADPPWSYQNSAKGSASGQYSTMSTLDICKLPISEVAEDNSVLFLWATFPLLPDALEVMKSWGFQYKTGLSWIKKTRNNKNQFGTGFILRSCSELLLIGFKGKPKVQNKKTRNIIEAVATGHSIKPDCQYQMIEKLFEGPYLELFARRPWKNWVGIGNQIFQGQEAFKDYETTGLFDIGIKNETKIS